MLGGEAKVLGGCAEDSGGCDEGSWRLSEDSRGYAEGRWMVEVVLKVAFVPHRTHALRRNSTSALTKPMKTNLATKAMSAYQPLP